MRDKQDSPRISVTNYTKIWNLDWVVYALEGKKLPMPANLRVMGIFVVVWIICWILSKTLLFFIPTIYTLVVIPVGLTWVIAKQKLDGKAPHKWLIGMIQFWIRPKRLTRYRKVVHNKHYLYETKVVYRTDRERA